MRLSDLAHCLSQLLCLRQLGLDIGCNVEFMKQYRINFLALIQVLINSLRANNRLPDLPLDENPKEVNQSILANQFENLASFYESTIFWAILHPRHRLMESWHPTWENLMDSGLLLLCWKPGLF